MTLEEDMRAYQARWKEVEAVIAEERRSAPLELRWRQLNAIFGMVRALGLVQPDQSEAEVYARWARLKDIAASRFPNI